MSLATDLAAYWSLDEASGNRADSHSGGYTLTDVNTVGSAAGVVSDAASFVSANSETLGGVTTLPNYSNTSPISFSFWFKGSSSTNFEMLSTRCNTSARAQWNIFLTNNASWGGGDRLSFEISPQNSGSNQLIAGTTTNTLRDGNWHHAVITYNGNRSTSGVLFYIDGTVDATVSVVNTLTTTNAPTNTPFYLGSRSPTFGTYFNGQLDEWGIWSRVLTSSEASELYNGGAGRNYAYITGGGGIVKPNFLGFGGI